MSRDNNSTKQEKALMIIEALAESYCMNQGRLSEHPKNCKWCQVYRIAHAGTSNCETHPKWDEEIELLFDEFSKE